MNDNIVVSELTEFVIKIAEKIAKRENQKYGNVKGWDAIVDSVNIDDTVNVTLPGEAEIIPNLKNKTDKTLVANDEVYLFSISSLSNAFIGIAKKP